jgi:hypothetical protein
MSVFPGNLDSDATLYIAKDNIETKLNAAMGISDTVAAVADPTGWVANMIATVELEQMLVTAVAGNLITVTRAFNGTTAATHGQNKKFSNFVDAAYQSSAKAAIIAIETALGTDLANVFVEYPTSVYDFTHIAPAEGLSPTARVVTLPEVPRGVNGGDTNHYLAIFNNAGVFQEVVLINGGTAVAGGTGFLTFASISGTYAAGSYKIGSATGGAAEAYQAIISGTGVGSILFDAQATMHQGVYAFSSSDRITFVGRGREAILAIRAQNYSAGNLFHNSVGASWTMRDLGISNGLPSTGAMAGAGVYIASGQIQMESVGIINGQFGVRLVGAVSTTLHNCTYVNTDMSFKAAAGLSLESLCINIFVSDCLFVGAPSSHANVLTSGIRLWAADGVWITNTLVSGDGGYAFNPQSDYIANVRIIGGGVDSARNYAVIFTGAGFPVHNIRFEGGHYHSQSDGTTLGLGPVVYADPSVSLNEIAFDGCFIAGGAVEGVQVLTTGMNDFSIRNSTIADNNVSNTAGLAGVRIGNGVTGFHLEGCTVGNIRGLGHQKYGVIASGTLTGFIDGNDLSVNDTGPIAFGSTLTGVFGSNQGVDNVTGTVASAASVDLPVNPTVTITGTTNVGTVTGLWNGRKVTLITTDGAVTFTAGATIGNTITSTQNKPLACVVTGGKIYLS